MIEVLESRELRDKSFDIKFNSIGFFINVLKLEGKKNKMQFICSNTIKVNLLEQQKSAIKSEAEIHELSKRDNVIALDVEFQGKGYGKKALIELIDMMQREYDLTTMTTTYTVGNTTAKNLYEGLGFEFISEVREGDIHEVNMAYFVDKKNYNYSLD